MKTLLFAICFITLTLNSFGQLPTAAIESPELNILYRGYENKIIPAVLNSNDREMLLIGKGVTITKPEGVEYYIAKTNNRDRVVSISVNLIDKFDTLFVREIQYRVSNLPDPYLYWGDARQDGNADLHEKNIDVKYPHEIPLMCTFKIVNWEVIVNEKSISGKGNDLSKAEALLKSVKTTTTVTIKMTVKSTDGILRMRQGTWNVNPWEITEESKVKLFH